MAFETNEGVLKLIVYVAVVSEGKKYFWCNTTTRQIRTVEDGGYRPRK